MPAKRRKTAQSFKRKATSRRARAGLSLVTWSLELSTHIGQRPSPASSGPPLAGTRAAVGDRRSGEADSEGSGPLPSAAGAKGEHEGETAPFGFPLVGAGRSPQETDRAGSRWLRVIALRRLRGCAPAPRRGKDRKGAGPSLALPSPRLRSGQWASSSSDGRRRLCSSPPPRCPAAGRVPQTQRVAVAEIQDRRCSHPPLESDARAEKKSCKLKGKKRPSRNLSGLEVVAVNLHSSEAAAQPLRLAMTEEAAAAQGLQMETPPSRALSGMYPALGARRHPWYGPAPTRRE